MVSWLLRAVAELGVWNCLGEHVRSTTVWQKKQSNATNRVERSRWRCSHTCNLTDKKQQHLHTLIQSRLFKALTQLHVYLESIVYLNSAEFPAFVQMRKKMIFKKKAAVTRDKTVPPWNNWAVSVSVTAAFNDTSALSDMSCVWLLHRLYNRGVRHEGVITFNNRGSL